MRTRPTHAAWTIGLILAMSGAVFAQPNRQASQAKGVDEQTIRTQDGWTLPITYYRFAGAETPAVILLHGEGGNRLVWRGLATKLHDAGFAVVTVDLRKHGDSQAPPTAGPRAERFTAADYNGMLLDLEAIKDFLLSKHQDRELNIRKTGIVAADETAPVAVNWTMADWNKAPWPDAPTLSARTPKGQDVRALALLSPSESAGRLSLGRVLPALRNDAFGVAFWLAVGVEDNEDRGAAEKAYERLTSGNSSAKDRVYLDRFERVKTRGTELLNVRGADVDGRIVKFMNDHLKALPDKWRDRRSRLQ